ncbi:MAG: DUF86 domain-containing protein [Burkholderiaceae bacterium]
MLRPEFVRRKLALIAEDLERLAAFRDLSLEALRADEVRLAAIERMLERVVMRAIDVNEHLIAALAGAEGRISRLTYRDTFLLLADLGVYGKEFAQRIAASAGLRNILVHDYNDADRRIVHASIASCLRDYREYVERVADFVDRAAPAPGV